MCIRDRSPALRLQEKLLGSQARLADLAADFVQHFAKRNEVVDSLSLIHIFDFVSGNILFMLTALGCAIFVGFVLKDDAKKELSPTPNSRFTTIWFNYVKFVVPVIILVIFISNLI